VRTIVEIPVWNFGGGISVWGGGTPKWYGYEDLVGYVPIVSEEVQNLKDLQGGNWKQRW
jgi:hypothetical protein